MFHSMPLDEMHRRLISQASGNFDAELPRLPEPAIQEQFVGSSFVPAFEEAKLFYETLIGYSKSLAMPVTEPDAKFLDFGCGWGRFLRYAMTNFTRDRLFAVDVDPDIIQICKNSGIPAQYSVIPPQGILPFSNDFFSHAMAYSVFTHLPEHLHQHWAKEIIRTLKPGGVFCGTIETRKFLTFIKGLDSPEKCTNDWHRHLAAFQTQADKLLTNYDNGEFVYLATGGGGMRTSDIYGDAVVSPGFIEKTWEGAYLRACIDDRFWQTVIILQKH